MEIIFEMNILLIIGLPLWIIIRGVILLFRRKKGDKLNLYKEIITNFSNSASICYAILKYIFITKIIDLKEIQIKINKIKEIQYVNEVQSQIAVSIYDEKEAESIYNETVYNLKSLNVKLNKKIPLFLK